MAPVLLAATLAAYLLGSIPFGLLLARRRGFDIRTVGSGNIGATNVARSLGKKLGAVVLVLDALKGALPVAVVRVSALDERVSPWIITSVALAAVVGHCFPIWLRFRGGKGVATALGTLLVLDPWAAAVGVVVFVALVAVWRIASLGSMAASVAVAAVLAARGQPLPVLLHGIGCVVLIAVTHRANIARLVRGDEHHV